MSNRTPRQFHPRAAERERVPLLIGLVGPSSSGKTKSALRLADGIISVVGGKHYVIDTESKRALHHADAHKFVHVPFDAPFGSLDYLDALKFCVHEGASVVTVDSISHEHENVGGMLDMQEQELQRLAGDDWRKREQYKFAAWIRPKRNRVLLLQGLLTLNCNFIFCFRAREKTKPVRAEGKVSFVQMGYQPIAGEEFLFEQTVNCLLLPKSEGVPTWHSEELGERATIKLPGYLEHCFEKEKPLDEQTGRRLADWAKGKDAASRRDNGKPGAPAQAARTGAPIPVPAPSAAAAPAAHAGGNLRDQRGDPQKLDLSPGDMPDADLFSQVGEALEAAAAKGWDTLAQEWTECHARYQNHFAPELPRLKDKAREADRARKEAQAR